MASWRRTCTQKLGNKIAEGRSWGIRTRSSLPSANGTLQVGANGCSTMARLPSHAAHRFPAQFQTLVDLSSICSSASPRRPVRQGSPPPQQAADLAGARYLLHCWLPRLRRRHCCCCLHSLQPARFRQTALHRPLPGQQSRWMRRPTSRRAGCASAAAALAAERRRRLGPQVCGGWRRGGGRQEGAAVGQNMLLML